MDVDDPDSFRQHLADWLPLRGKGVEYSAFGVAERPVESEVFEATNVTAVFRFAADGDRDRVDVKLWRPTPQHRIPKAIWDVLQRASGTIRTDSGSVDSE